MAPIGTVLCILAVVFAWPAPVVLRKYTHMVEPGILLILWQAIGLGGGISLLGASFILGIAPALEQLSVLHSSFIQPFAWYNWVFLGLAAVIFIRLLTALIVQLVSTQRWRTKHQNLVALLTTPSADFPATRILQSDEPTAYCVPGRRTGTTVITTGLVKRLSTPQLQAVLEHERAHLKLHHGILVLPFAAWQQALPLLPATSAARESVTMLVEFMADDRARQSVPAEVLAEAIAIAQQSAGAATAALAQARIRRLHRPASRARVAPRFAAASLSAAVLLGPAVLLGVALSNLS